MCLSCWVFRRKSPFECLAPRSECRLFGQCLCVWWLFGDRRLVCVRKVDFVQCGVGQFAGSGLAHCSLKLLVVLRWGLTRCTSRTL